MQVFSRLIQIYLKFFPKVGRSSVGKLIFLQEVLNALLKVDGFHKTLQHPKNGSTLTENRKKNDILNYETRTIL